MVLPAFMYMQVQTEIIDGQPALSPANFTMQLGINSANEKLFVTFNSPVTQNIILEIRAINNMTGVNMGTISIVANEEKVIELSTTAFNFNAVYLLLANGQNNAMQVKPFLK